MARYTGTVADQNGVPIGGARVLVQASNTGALASLTDDSAGFLPNPVVTDALGSFIFNVTPGLYDLTYQAAKGGRVIRVDNAVQIGTPQIDPVVNGAIQTAVDAAQASTADVIAALTTSSIGEGARLYFTVGRAQAAITGSTTATVAAGVVSQTKQQALNALGFTPYDATNPSSFVGAAGARSAISGSTTVSYNATTGSISLSAINIAAALGAAPLLKSGGTLTGPLLLAANPTDPLGGATKQYVDAIAGGANPKVAVKAASPGNSTTLYGTQTRDGVALGVNDRFLEKDNSDPVKNGFWLVQAADWTRAPDADTYSELPNATVFVTSGTVNAGTKWKAVIPATGAIGTTPIVFTQDQAANTVTASGAVTASGNLVTLTPATQGTALGTAAGGGTAPPAARTIADIQGYTSANVNGQTFTDTIGVTATTSASSFLNSPAGNPRTQRFLTNGVLRWNVGADAGAESGSNFGSDYVLQAYSDGGTLLRDALRVYRSSGDGAFNAHWRVGAAGKLGAIWPNIEGVAQNESQARIGGPAYAGVTYSADNGLPSGSMIAYTFGSFCFNNAVGGNSQYGLGYYADVVRAAGAGNTFGCEFDATNLGAVVDVNPATIYIDGSTGCFWGSSGRPGLLGAAAGAQQDISFWGAVVNNGTAFRRGLVFGYNALSTNEAVSMDQPHALAWYVTGSKASSFDGFGASMSAFSNTDPWTFNFVHQRANNTNTINGDTTLRISGWQTTGGTPERRSFIETRRVTAARSSMSIAAFTGASAFNEWGINLAADNAFGPALTGSNLAAASVPINNSYFDQAPTISSDRRLKQNIEEIPQALIDAVMATPKRRFKFIESVEAKGLENARWNYGIIAQELWDNIVAHGLDPAQHAPIGRDPWMEPYEDIEEVEEQIVDEVEEAEMAVTFANGVAMQAPKTTIRKVPRVEEVPVVDSHGRPVMGRQTPEKRDADGRVVSALVPPQQITAGRPVTHKVQKLVVRERQRIDPLTGAPMFRLSIKPDQLATIEAEAMRRRQAA